MMSNKPRYIAEHEGFRLEWFSRRSEYEVNVYHGSVCVAELGYPKLFGASLPTAHESFKAEAVGIAKREMARADTKTLPDGRAGQWL